MKINKLDDEIFYDFVSQKIGINVRLYKDVLQMNRVEKGVKLKVYLGGESEDLRKFYFTDIKCIFVNPKISQSEQNISYDWVQFLLDYADELTDDEKQGIVDEYNEHLEQEIKTYASSKREMLISL